MPFHRSFLFIGALALSGCNLWSTQPVVSANSVSVGLDFANTSLGYRNSGLYSPGRLYLWDQERNELTRIAQSVDLPEIGRTGPQTMEASRVGGFSLVTSATLPDTATAEIATRIERDLSFRIADAERVRNGRIYSAISEAYRRTIDEGVDAYRAWRVEDAVTQPSRYKYVLIIEPIYATSETITLDNTASGEASFTVASEELGAISVEIPETATASCSGAQALCYFDVAVMTASLNDNRNLDYTPAAYSSAALSEAFRK